MKFNKLKLGQKTYTSEDEIYSKIEELNEQNGNIFDWLLNSEFQNADIEIKKNTLIWNNGDFRFGYWKYGIFKDGKFYGIWENGIWENGIFSGKWISGIGR